MMKKIGLVLLFFFLSNLVSAQEEGGLSLGFSTGKLNSTYYRNAVSKSFFSFDMDYGLNKKWLFSFNYLMGNHTYYEDSGLLPGMTLYNSDGTNSKASYRNSSVLIKYRFLNEGKIHAAIGAGLGVLVKIRDEPIATVSAGGTAISRMTFDYTEIAFPLRAEIDYRFMHRFRIGLIAGTFVQPDYAFLAHHLGARLKWDIN